MADQRWSDIYVVFTKILCGRNFCTSVCKSQRFFEQTVVEFCYRQTDRKACKQEQKNPAFENIAIRIAIWELIDFESVHLMSNRIKSNVILQSRAHNQESGTKFEKLCLLQPVFGKLQS